MYIRLHMRHFKTIYDCLTGGFTNVVICKSGPSLLLQYKGCGGCYDTLQLE